MLQPHVMIGQVLGHYKIESQLGAGGMGVVYRAYDTRLRRTVAIKFLAGTPDEASRSRLMSEARAVSALNHPNICTIYEVAEDSGRTCIVMELVEGKPLQSIIPPGGLAQETVSRYGYQIADALKHAHDRGVVHRDLKSANIIVTPEGRVKVLDFGLARRLPEYHLEDGTHSHSALVGRDQIAGTPAYMAPELLGGVPADVRSDIWALGILLFEMTCGHVPFRAEGDRDLASAIFRNPVPEMPEGVPPVLRAVILRCLQKEPWRRYERADEVMAVLETSHISAVRSVPARYPVAAAASVILLAAFVVGSVIAYQRRWPARQPRDGASAPASAVRSRKAIAVLGFKNLSGEPSAAWLSTALSEMLTTELAAGEALRTISGENVLRMKNDLTLSDADTFAPDTLARIRSNLGSDLVVVGSYITVGERIRFDVRLQDAGAGETIASVAETGTDDELLDVVSRIGARLRDRLGVAGLSAADASRVRASLPSSPAAARLYADGLLRLRLFDAQAARAALEQAVSADPNQPLAHSALSVAWALLGYDEKARESARRAYELSTNLTREERLGIEGRYHESFGQRDKAIATYRMLFDFFPDNVEYGLQLAAAQTAAGKGRDPLATIDALRRLRHSATDDARIDVAEAAVARSLSDFKRQQAASTRAALKGQELGARLLVARARLSEGMAWQDLGDPGRAISACEEARRAYASAGDRGGEARALRSMAVVLRAQGDLVSAKRMYQQALATSREIGDRSGTALSLNNIANVLRQEGALREAGKVYGEALAIFREIGDKSNVSNVLNNSAIGLRLQGDLRAAKATYMEALAIRRAIGEKAGVAATLNNLANVLYDEGDVAGAKKMYEETLAIREEIGEKRGVATAWLNIAGVLRLQGDLPGARKLYEQALAIYRESEDRSAAAGTLRGIGAVLALQGRLSEARTHYEEAISVQDAIGEKGAAASSRVELAELAVEEGRAEEAVALARDAAEYFRAAKAIDDEAIALAALARALLAEGKASEAREIITRAAALEPGRLSRLARFEVALASARIDVASGASAAAAKRLRALMGAARGIVGDELEASLALGEAEIAAGRMAAGRAHLEALAKEAAAKGFLLIARKADARL